MSRKKDGGGFAETSSDFPTLAASVAATLDEGTVATVGHGSTTEHGPTSSALFPHSMSSTATYGLFSRLPEFASLPAVESPRLETFGAGQYENRWLLFITTGNKRKAASMSLLEIWKKIEDFYLLNCLVFVLSTDNWDNLVRFRCRRVLDGGLGGRLDINLLAVQKTEKNMRDMNALGLINEETEAPNGWKFCYPAFLLYCPDKTLVEKIIYCDAGSGDGGAPMVYTVKTDQGEEETRSVFQWPIVTSNVDRILLLIKKMTPLYALAKGCGMDFQCFCEELAGDPSKIENPNLASLYKEVLSRSHN